MEWTPNQEGIKELVNLFKDSLSSDNNSHRIIVEKINSYCSNKEFSNYLLFILNSEDVEIALRQLSGLTLKGILERQFNIMEPQALHYFKKGIFDKFLHPEPNIRKTISNLINTFIQKAGLENWPEILNILYTYLDHQAGASMSLETLIIIFEDNCKKIEHQNPKVILFLIKFFTILTEKLLFFLANIDGNSEGNQNLQFLIILVLKLLLILLENSPNHLGKFVDSLYKGLSNLIKLKNSQINLFIGKCYILLIRYHNSIYDGYLHILIYFFNDIISTKNYESNLTACEFYLFLINSQMPLFIQQFFVYDTSVKNSSINYSTLNPSNDLSILLTIFYNFCKLSQNDLCQVESENKEYKIKKTKYDIEDYEENQEDNEIEESDDQYFNKQWSLRKCCCEILEKLSKNFPDQLTAVIIPLLEKDIGQTDWLIKERSIHVLGVICQGSITVIKPNLENLTNYLVGELSNSNKLIRATSCNSLSKLSDYIVNDSCENLLKLYLSELLKRFLDNEPIVQETACSTFNTLVVNYKEKIAPYLGDIYRIITSIFETYTGSSLMTLYDCLVLLSENYPDSFLDLDLVCELLYGILGKWCSFISTVKEHHEQSNIIPLKNVTSPNFFDIVIAVFKISYEIFFCHFDDFFNGCLLIIELYPQEREIICRCMDLISVIMQNLPFQFINNQNRGSLISLIKNISKLDDDYGYKQYVIALIGDISKVEPTLLTNHFDELMLILLENLDRFYDRNTISICNNSCWTIGVLTKSFKDSIDFYFEPIISKIITIFSMPKMNKSLAQNAAICFGRMGLVNSLKLSNYLGTVTKQFCLSMKLVKDGPEKEDAFSGFCEALIKNPNGIYKNFAFFSDSVCNYSNPPQQLELLFQNIFSSYKALLDGKWYGIFNTFPEKLRIKMKTRFPFLQE